MPNRKSNKSKTPVPRERSASLKRIASTSPQDGLEPKTPKHQNLIQSTMHSTVFGFDTSTPTDTTAVSQIDKQGETVMDNTQQGETEMSDQTDCDEVNNSQLPGSISTNQQDISYPSTLLNFISEAGVDVMTTKLSNALLLPEIETKFRDLFMTIAREIINKLLEEHLTPLKKQIAEQQQQAQMKTDIDNIHINALRSEIADLKEQLLKKTDEQEQYSRRNSIRISGIPEKRRENIDDVVMGVLSKVHEGIKVTDIDRCHRVGKKGSDPRQVIVKFVSYRVRKMIISNRRKLKKSPESDNENADATLNNTMSDVYINEDLTTYRSKLFKKARQLKKDKKIHSTWTYDGRICVQQEMDGDIEVIDGESDLDEYSW